MRQRTWVVLAACASIAGCSSSSEKPAPHASASASASPSVAADGSVHVSQGSPQTQTLPAAAKLSPGESATLYGYQQPVSVGRALDALAQQFVFGVADVKVCLGSKPATQVASLTDRRSWVLHYANGTIIDPAAIRYPKQPAPVYPFTVSPTSAGAANTCIRGKIVYPVPRTSSPVSIVYAPAGVTGSLTFRIG